MLSLLLFAPLLLVAPTLAAPALEKKQAELGSGCGAVQTVTVWGGPGPAAAATPAATPSALANQPQQVPQQPQQSPAVNTAPIDTDANDTGKHPGGGYNNALYFTNW